MSIFSEVPVSKPPTNSFNLSHDFKLSLDMGFLVPLAMAEAIPGDHWNISTSLMARMAPLMAPIMHDVDIDVQSFFVPNRIVWDGWEKFITAGTPDETTPAAPYFAATTFAEGSLADYLGVPPNKPIDKLSAIPFAAYSAIYNEYYRDQNLIPDLTYKLSDGLNAEGTLQFLHRRAWQHDYFTSALPFAQKGDPVTIPLGTSAPIDYVNPTNKPSAWRNLNGTTPAAGLQDLSASYPSSFAGGTAGDTVTPTSSFVAYDPNGTLVADLTEASAVTINALRYAVRLQEYLERNARGGTRYIEHILSHFGVRSSDKRLQRPEFLGGSRQSMVISEVLQNAPATDTADTPQGNMAGHGISVGGGKTLNYFAEEHGIVLVIASIRPKTAYQQGLHRMWSRFDPLQYAWPSFANLGEQEILNQELYYDNSDGLNDDVFGYTPRYSEYKYLDSRVAGEFRTSLSQWHMGRIFVNRPALNGQFITSDPTTRIFAVEEGAQHVYMHVKHQIIVRRRLPKYGIPTL